MTETITITGPAAWATALVNGDYSGLQGPDDIPDLVHLVRWLRANPGYEIVDVARDEDGEAKDPRFTWSYALHGGAHRGGDVVDYVAVSFTGSLRSGAQLVRARRELREALARRRAAKRPETVR